MGRYVDWNDVAQRYSSVTKDYSAEAAAPIILDAEAEVDARLAARYTVPFGVGTYAPQVVRTLSIDLAYYRMIWTQDIAKILKENIDFRLKALLAGSMTIVQSGSALAVDAGAWTDKDYRSSFGPDDPIDYSVSSAWQFDAAQERLFD